MTKYVVKSIHHTLFIKKVSDDETIWTSNIGESLKFNRIGDAMKLAIAENKKYGEILFKVTNYTPVSSKL